MKKRENHEKYQILAWEVLKERKMMKTVIPIIIGALRTVPNNLQKKMWGQKIEDNKDYPDHSAAEIIKISSILPLQ